MNYVGCVEFDPFMLHRTMLQPCASRHRIWWIVKCHTLDNAVEPHKRMINIPTQKCSLIACSSFYRARNSCSQRCSLSSTSTSMSKSDLPLQNFHPPLLSRTNTACRKLSGIAAGCLLFDEDIPCVPAK